MIDIKFIRVSQRGKQEEGSLIEEDTHEDLLKRKENYYSMWKEQFPMLQ